MKKVLSVLVAVLLVVVACVPAFAASYNVRIDSVDTAKVGEEVTFSVTAPAGVASYGVTFSYDTNYFSYVSSASTELFGLPMIGDQTAGMVKFAGTSINAIAQEGVAFTVTLKVVKTGGTVRATVTEASDNNDVDVLSQFGTAPSKTIAATPATPTTTKAPATTTTKAPAGGNGSAATTAKGNSVNIPKTGGSVSVVAGGVSVLALAAAVAYTMKKKNNEE